MGSSLGWEIGPERLVNKPEVFGKKHTAHDVEQKPIAKIGGSFATNHTKLGSFELPAGTWLVNASVVFDRLDSTEATDEAPTTDTYPQFAIRYGDDYAATPVN